MYCSTVIVILHEYKTKLTASEEEQQELLRVLEQTKRMGYARDLQISMLESVSTAAVANLVLQQDSLLDSSSSHRPCDSSIWWAG